MLGIIQNLGLENSGIHADKLDPKVCGLKNHRLCVSTCLQMRYDRTDRVCSFILTKGKSRNVLAVPLRVMGLRHGVVIWNFPVGHCVRYSQ